MKYVFGLAAVVLVGLGAFAIHGATKPPKTGRVQVHCPDGNRNAFVTPASLHIAVGDSVDWRMTGQVTSDSLIIALKDTAQVWPFAGKPPRGGTSATAAAAARKGTYGYSVTLDCRVPAGGTQHVVIDPDIIIE
jgi:plastocyanin